MIKKIILSLVAFICLFGIMYSTDFSKGEPDLEIEVKAYIPSAPECQLFYIKKEEINKCIGTLKASNVYESDPYGKKVESMMIIPGI
jgi:hypothetical protein